MCGCERENLFNATFLAQMVSRYFDVWTKQDVINDKQLKLVLAQICSENNWFWHCFFQCERAQHHISKHWAKNTVQLNKLFYLFIFYFITSLHPNFISEQPVLLAEGWPTSLLQSTRALWFLREFNLVHTAVDSVLEDEAMLLLQVKPNKGLVSRRSPMSPGQGPKTL